MSRTQMFEPLESRLLLDAQPVGPEFRVNTHTTNTQHEPCVATDADGDFVIAWTSFEQDGSLRGIYAQRFDRTGATAGSEFPVNTFTTARQWHAAVAMDSAGNFVVTWDSGAQDGSGYGVYAQRYDAAGVPLGGEFRVNTYTTGGQGFPSVAADADGDFVIAFDGAGQGDDPGVFAQRYNASGVPLGGEFRVNTYTTNAQGTASVAMDADGDFVVVWLSYLQDGSNTGVYAQRYNAAGEPQGGEFRVNTFTTSAQRPAQVAMDADGDFVITWGSFGQDGSDGSVHAQRYNAAGLPQGGEFRINTTTILHQEFPSVAMDADGDFVVAWDSGGYGLLPPPDVYAQRYDAAGAAQAGELTVNTYTTSLQRFATVAMDADGDFVVAWNSQGQDGSSYGIYAQRYAIRPEVNDSSFLFDTAPHRLQFIFDRDVSASLGTDDIVLENLTTMQTIPSNDLALAYEPLTNTATFSYVGPGASAIAGVLPDGDYRATLLAAGISTPAGGQLAQDYVLDFFFLNGDANRDRRVNLDDFNILAANFGQSPRDFTQGDFNYDTIVNLNDFNILAARFGQSVSPATFGGESVRSPEQGSRMFDTLRDDILA